MKIGGTATNREVLNDVIVTEAVGYHISILLVFAHLNLLFIEINVKAQICLLKVYDIEIVYKYIRKDGT